MLGADLGFLMVPGLVWWLALGAALLVGLWAYWRLPAPLGRPERLLLHGLRLAALVVILLLLLEPLLTLRRGDSGRPRMAILVDRSSSMRLPGHEGGERAQEASAVLARLEEDLGKRFALDVYGFADGLERRGGEETGYPWRPLGATALGEALEEVLLRQGESPLGAVVVVSDGVHTSGKDPLRVARNLPVPVYAVMLGDTVAPPDLQVREIRVQPFGHVGEPLALRAWLQDVGLNEWDATVTVRERTGGTLESSGAGPELDRRRVSLRGSAAEAEVTLEVVPRHPGVTLYEIAAAVPDAESVSVNNRRLVAVDVRERKTRVLYMEGEPDWDFSFLKRTLDADTTLSYTYLVRQADGDFLQYGEPDPRRLPESRADFEPFAAVILGRMSPEDLPADFVAALREYLLEGGGVLFLDAGARAGVERWAEAGWGEFLPLTVTPQRRWGLAASACQPTFQGITHEVTALAENPAETERIWRAFPPLWIHEGDYLAAQGATILLAGRTAHPEREVPLLAIASAGAGRIGVLAGRGFWRWDFAMRSVDPDPRAARDFWKRLARWLTEPSEQEHFAIRPVRPVFQDSEPVSFSARLFDEGFRPIPAARVEVAIEAILPGNAAPRGGDPLLMSLYPEGAAGRYAGALKPLPPGAYRYDARARTSEGPEGRLRHAEGHFWVEPMGPEFYELASSPKLLAHLAQASGGISRTSAQIDELLERIPVGYRRTPVVKQAEIWNHWAAFAFLAAVLVVEWIWRRRRGLA